MLIDTTYSRTTHFQLNPQLKFSLIPTYSTLHRSDMSKGTVTLGPVPSFRKINARGR